MMLAHRSLHFLLLLLLAFLSSASAHSKGDSKLVFVHQGDDYHYRRDYHHDDYQLIMPQVFDEKVNHTMDNLILFLQENLSDDFSEGLLGVLGNVKRVFRSDTTQVYTGITLIEEAVGKQSDNPFAKYLPENADFQFVFFPRVEEDITCLLSPPPVRSKGEFFLEKPPNSVGHWTSSQVVEYSRKLVKFINEVGKRFRKYDGTLNPLGEKKKELEENVYHVPLTEEKKTCERLTTVPTKQEFFDNYLSKSKPVIIEGGTAHWEALDRWNKEFLREQYAGTEVHVKLTPDGEFEGCDDVTNWEGHESRVIPERALKKIEFPNKVVVRPAGHQIEFEKFMEMLSESSEVSAYLEYTSLTSTFPELKVDISPLTFVENLLIQRHLNIWIGNGKTLGKLHFDPFDNLLCQVTGEKHAILFDPGQSGNLYEGHIPEAMLSYSFQSVRQNKFKKDTLLESTSMVMSPVDILKPDFESFPKYDPRGQLHCPIKKGDVLFIPAFWWHEVQSKPDENFLNIAVNFWFEPFF